ncbi:Dihydroorotate dehydrogenase, electron transfer subunit, iron-sulfur cluster binding domain protein [Dehalogenimonas lykanthroporepellens BL-DC-9]|jgi:dihydroorotate dehydrogenase electron transfer subunit|nr:Dihydroorotate dehydrogenase, electron transfer subunit, iron-sulfur cluster binding domain protein [Dehalogenimonas lykanthroporepellens BL-DC-9]
MADPRSRRHSAEVLANDSVMPGVFRLRLKCPAVASSARPGQFVMVSCDNHLLRRPVSIAGADVAGGEISLLIASVGTGTAWLKERQSGDWLDVLGPQGNGFTIDEDSNKLLLVGGGMGIAPLNFLAEYAGRLRREVTLVLGARTAELLCPPGHLADTGECLLFTEDGSAGTAGRVTDCPDSHIATADQIFVCGPIPMYRALAQDARFTGRPVQVSLEVRMACGTGLCYGCTIKTTGGLRQVCSHGPVFRMDEVAWPELADL